MRDNRTETSGRVARSAAVTRQAPLRCWRGTGGSGYAGSHFLIRREAPCRLLGEGQPPIDGDLENPTATPAQADLGGWMGVQDQVPRRDRTRLIASHSAVFDFDQHLLDVLRVVDALKPWQRRPV
jgi:hypothetical protein